MQNHYYNLPGYILFSNTYFKDIFCQEQVNKKKRGKKCTLLAVEYLLACERILA